MTQAKSIKNKTTNGQRPEAATPCHVTVPMTPARARVIQSKTMKKTGTVRASDFAARAQSGAAHNVTNDILQGSELIWR